MTQNVSRTHRECPECRAVFQPTSNRQKRCTSCRWPSKACEACGAAFRVPNWKSQRYCSKVCSVSQRDMSALRALRKTNTGGTPGPRHCAACNQVYQPTSSRQTRCSTCVPDQASRARHLRYGVSAQDWADMLARYAGQCWVCRKRAAICVDHNHATGAVRGALCRTCNMVLHYVEHPNWWAAAKAYLEGGDDHCAP